MRVEPITLWMSEGCSGRTIVEALNVPTGVVLWTRTELSDEGLSESSQFLPGLRATKEGELVVDVVGPSNTRAIDLIDSVWSRIKDSGITSELEDIEDDTLDDAVGAIIEAFYDSDPFTVSTMLNTIEARLKTLEVWSQPDGFDYNDNEMRTENIVRIFGEMKSKLDKEVSDHYLRETAGLAQTTVAYQELEARLKKEQYAHRVQTGAYNDRGRTLSEVRAELEDEKALRKSAELTRMEWQNQRDIAMRQATEATERLKHLSRMLDPWKVAADLQAWLNDLAHEAETDAERECMNDLSIALEKTVGLPPFWGASTDGDPVIRWRWVPSDDGEGGEWEVDTSQPPPHEAFSGARKIPELIQTLAAALEKPTPCLSHLASSDARISGWKRCETCDRSVVDEDLDTAEKSAVEAFEKSEITIDECNAALGQINSKRIPGSEVPF